MSHVEASIAQAVKTFESLRALEADILRAAALVKDCLGKGGKLMACGNGGSAADVSDFTTEYVCRFQGDRQPFPAINLTADGSLLTATGNDYGFDHIFARQVRAFGRTGDVVIVVSTSGRSKNIILALEEAKSFSSKPSRCSVGMAERRRARRRLSWWCRARSRRESRKPTSSSFTSSAAGRSRAQGRKLIDDMPARWPRPSFYAVIALVIALDQLTKAWVTASFRLGESMTVVPGFFNLTYCAKYRDRVRDVPGRRTPRRPIHVGWPGRILLRARLQLGGLGAESRRAVACAAARWAICWTGRDWATWSISSMSMPGHITGRTLMSPTASFASRWDGLC